MSYPSNSLSTSGELTFTKSVQVAKYAVLVQRFKRETVQSTTKYWIGELIVLDLNDTEQKNERNILRLCGE
jgi:hypothetical protein